MSAIKVSESRAELRKKLLLSQELVTSDQIHVTTKSRIESGVESFETLATKFHRFSPNANFQLKPAGKGLGI